MGKDQLGPQTQLTTVTWRVLGQFLDAGYTVDVARTMTSSRSSREVVGSIGSVGVGYPRSR